MATSNKTSGKKIAENKKKPTPSKSSGEREKLNNQIMNFKNPLSFVEQKYSTQYHDIKIFIQGTDVSPFMVEDLTIETSLDGNGVLRFKLDNAGDKFTLTDKNLTDWDPQSVVDGKGSFSYRTNYDAAKEALDEVNSTINNIKKSKTLANLQQQRSAASVVSAALKYGVTNVSMEKLKKEELNAKKKDKENLENYMGQKKELEEELRKAALSISAAPLSISDVYTEKPKAQIYAYKIGKMFSSTRQNIQYVKDVLDIEDERYNCAFAANERQPSVNKDGQPEITYPKPKEPEIHSILKEDIVKDLNIVLPNNLVEYTIELELRKKENKESTEEYNRQLKKWKSLTKNAQTCSSSYTQMFTGESVKLKDSQKIYIYIYNVLQSLPTKVFSKVNWTEAKSLIVSHVVSFFYPKDNVQNKGGSSRKTEVEKLLNFAYLKFLAKKRLGISDLTKISGKEYKKLTTLKSNVSNALITDTLTGETIFPFTVNRPVFHRNDPVRVFVHNPYSSYDSDEWLPKFTGYIKEVSVDDDSITGQSIVSLEAVDLKGLMERMRFQTQKSLYLAVPIIELQDKNDTLFNDNMAQQSDNYTIFRNKSISDIFDLVILGYQYSSTGGKKAYSYKNTPIGRLKKGYTVFYPPNDPKTGKPEVDLEDVKVFDLDFLTFQKEKLQEGIETIKGIKEDIVKKFTYMQLLVLGSKYGAETAEKAKEEKGSLEALINDKLKARESYLTEVCKDATSDKTLGLYNFYKNAIQNYEKYSTALNQNYSKSEKSLFDKYSSLKAAEAKEKNLKKKYALQDQLKNVEAKLKNTKQLENATILRDFTLNEVYSKDLDLKYKSLSTKLSAINKKLDKLTAAGKGNISEYTKYKRNLLSRWHYLTLFGAMPKKEDLIGGQYSGDMGLTKRLITDEFGDFSARLLTEEEVNLIGFGTTTNGPWAPDNSFFHSLLPNGGSGSGLTSYQFEPGGDTKAFSTRLALINEYTDILDYKWYISPIGDVIMEFPFYDFYPEDLGDIENLFKVKYDIINETFADETGDMTTVLELHGTPPNKNGTGAAVQAMPAALQPRVFVWCPILLPRLGFKQQLLQYGFIGSTTVLAGLGIVKFQKLLLEASKWTLNMIAREGLGLNRPIYSEDSFRMGLIAGVSYAYSFESTQSISLNITAVKRLRRDRTFRFLSGGAHMPINYGNILTGKNFDALKNYAKSQGLRIAQYSHRFASQGFKGSATTSLTASKQTSAKKELPLMRSIISNYFAYSSVTAAPPYASYAMTAYQLSSKVNYLNMPFPDRVTASSTSKPATGKASRISGLGGSNDCNVISSSDCAAGGIVLNGGPASKCKCGKITSIKDVIATGLRSTTSIIGNKNIKGSVELWPVSRSGGKNPKPNGYLAYLELALKGSLSDSASLSLAEALRAKKITADKINKIRGWIINPSYSNICGGSCKSVPDCYQKYQDVFEAFRELDSFFEQNKSFSAIVSKVSGYRYLPLISKMCPERANLTKEALADIQSEGNDFIIALYTSQSLFFSTGTSLYNIYNGFLGNAEVYAALAASSKGGNTAVSALLQKPFLYNTEQLLANPNDLTNFSLVKSLVPFYGGLLTSKHFYSLMNVIRKAGGPSTKSVVNLVRQLGKLWWTNRLFIVRNAANNTHMVCRAVETRNNPAGYCEVSYNYKWALKTNSTSGNFELSYFLNAPKSELDILKKE